MEYTAVVKHSGEWWIGWIEEVPGVNCQERTHEELHQSLADALAEALEFNRRDALAAAHRSGGRRSAVPRHREINDILARKICRDLGVDPVGRDN